MRYTLELDSDYVDAWHNLANLLADSGRLDDACNAFRQVLRREPDYADAHYGLAETLEQRGEHDAEAPDDADLPEAGETFGEDGAMHGAAAEKDQDKRADEFAEEKRSTVSELRGEVTKLMAGIGHGNGSGAGWKARGGEDASEVRIAEFNPEFIR